MKRRKILLNIGTLVSLACPVAIVLSCGECNNNGDDSKKINQDKMNGITAAMVKAALNITPSSSALPSTISQPKNSTATLNGLDDVAMTISKWTHDDPNGEINADVSISKPGSGLKPPSSPFNIKWTGFKTTGQNKMNGITAAMVRAALNITPSSSALPSTISQPGNSTATLNHLAGVSITISQWTYDDPNGKIIADVSVSKTGLTPPTSSPFTIEWTGYLTTDQHKMNGITAAMVKTALNITPSNSALPSTISQPGNSTATLNHLAGVSMTISKWAQDNSHGKIVATVSVSKTGLTPPPSSPFSIELTGYLTTDQDKMNGITAAMVRAALNITPSSSALPSTINQPGNSTATLNHLAGVSMTISKWAQDDQNGKIIADVSVSKTGLTPPPSSPFTIELMGYLTTDQHKMNGITAAMVKTALNITPSSSALPSTINQPGNSTATLNHLAGVSMTISKWAQDNSHGKIAATVSVSKTGLISPTSSPFTIEWTGYLTTDQDKMNGITAAMVRAALNITPSSSALPSTISQPGNSTATLNNLAGVSITISQWTYDDPNGKIIADVSVSKTGLTPPPSSPFTIELTGYLTTDQHKMNDITAAMVRTALNITPSSSALPSTINQPGNSTATLNNLAGVSMTISKWAQDNSHGKIVATVSVSKTGLTPPPSSPFTIEWTGYLTTDQDKMNGITAAMVKTALNITPSNSALPSTINQPGNSTATLNNLAGVSMTISKWAQDDPNGKIIADVSVSKTGLTPPPSSPFTIEWTGYLTTDQNKMNGITTKMVYDVIKKQLAPDVSKDVPNVPNDFTATLNGLSNVKITISDWTPTYLKGSIVMSATVSKTGLISHSIFKNILIDNFNKTWKIKHSTTVNINTIPSIVHGFSQKIDATHYLIGTNSNGLYQVTVDTDGMVTKSTSVPMTGSNSIPRVDYGFSQKIDATHYLIGTHNNGLYQVTVDANGMIAKSTPISMTGPNSIPNVQRGFSQKIDATHYLIGTRDRGAYQITVDANGMIAKSTPISMTGLNSIPSVGYGFSQKIDATHYLIGTNSDGVYQVTVDANGMIAKSTPISMTGPNSIPNVQRGFSQKIDATHYLIGTNSDGVFQVTVDANGMIAKSTPISMTGTNSIPNVQNGFSQKIDATHYLIGTNSDGVFQVTVDANGMIAKSTPISMTGPNSIPSVWNGWIEQIDNNHYLIGTLAMGVYQVEYFE